MIRRESLQSVDAIRAGRVIAVADNLLDLDRKPWLSTPVAARNVGRLEAAGKPGGFSLPKNYLG